MISATAKFVLQEGSVTYFDTDIKLSYAYNYASGLFLVTLNAVTASGANSWHGSHNVGFTTTDVHGKTGTGTDPHDKLLNQLEQLAKDYLDDLTENTGITFTIT